METKSLPVISLTTLAAIMGLSGCGTQRHLANKPSVHSHSVLSGKPSPSAVPSSVTSLQRTRSSSNNHASSHSKNSSTVSFPPLVASILSHVQETTSAPLWGPTTLPRGNSAKTLSTPHSFSAQIFACPVAEPLNGPGVGQSNCGAMVSIAENFGSTRYPSDNAARTALQAVQPPAFVTDLSSHPRTTQLLPGGIPARRWFSGQTASSGTTIAVNWKEGDWTLWVYGGTGLWNTAVMVTTQLQRYRLPPYPGILIVDAAPDGQHTSLTWLAGNVLYQAGAEHQSLHAIVIASSMKKYSPS